MSKSDSPNIYAEMEQRFYDQDWNEAWAIYASYRARDGDPGNYETLDLAAHYYNQRKLQTNEQGEIVEYDVVKNAGRWAERKGTYLLAQARVARNISDEQPEALTEANTDDFDENLTIREPYESDLAMVERAIERYGYMLRRSRTDRNLTYLTTMHDLEKIHRNPETRPTANLLEAERTYSLEVLKRRIDLNHPTLR